MFQDNQNISFSAISYIVFENFFLHRKCTLMCNICFTILHRWFRGIASSSLRSTTPFSSAMGRATLRCFFPCLAKDIQIEYQMSTTDFFVNNLWSCWHLGLWPFWCIIFSHWHWLTDLCRDGGRGEKASDFSESETNLWNMPWTPGGLNGWWSSWPPPTSLWWRSSGDCMIIVQLLAVAAGGETYKMKWVYPFSIITWNTIDIVIITIIIEMMIIMVILDMLWNMFRHVSMLLLSPEVFSGTETAVITNRPHWFPQDGVIWPPR